MFANGGVFAQPDMAVTLAQTAEDAGFDSIWTVEHAVVPADYESAYPYSRSGRMPGGEDTDIPDPLVWLAYVAAHTQRIALATGILILPQRNPVIVAKEVATLDVLSGGRVLLGVGVGWLREEFDALGVPFEERGARTDEYVELLRRLWREPEVSHDGAFVHLRRAKSNPKPARDAGVPIVIGGHTPAAARRAGRLGDGFFPAQGNLDTLPALLEEMRRAAAEAGRDPGGIEITAGGALDAEGAKPYADLGVDRLVVPPLAFDAGSLVERLRRFGDEVIARTR